MTTTTSALIPDTEHSTGFVAVALRFPDDPTAHRVTRVFTRPDETEAGQPARFDGPKSTTAEIRPACRPDSDPAERLYELSIPTALARGAVACDQRECFGGVA
jgi:hypothetical protein